MKIRKNFVNTDILKDLDLRINEGEFFSLLGPSGCGKTTLLRLIAGLEIPSSGKIFLDQKEIQTLSPQLRPFHLVFQKYALFPHMTVFDNVAFGLRLRKTPPVELKSRVKEALSLVALDGFEARRPETLSGGQAQRVALARALVNRPRLLLLDEPLSALDPKLREKTQFELKQLQRKTGITFVFVTHDQAEALALSDRIAVMNRGQIEQLGRPQEIYENPQTLFVADFIGESNFLRESLGLRMIRPENLHLSQNSPGHLQFHGHIRQTLFRGTELEVQLELGDAQLLRFLVSSKEWSHWKKSVGDAIAVEAAEQLTRLYPEDRA